MSKREESADSGACVFVRIMRARGLSVQDGDLKSTFKAIEEYKMTPTTRDPSCLCQVTSGRLEGATGVCERAGGIPRNGETPAYVREVLRHWRF